MKRLLTITLALTIVLGAGSALATLDWAGNVFPNDGAAVVPTGNVTVYAQVYKAGATDPAGQAADITAELQYTTDIAATVAVAMGYLGDVGSNDEYSADIPQSALVGASWVDVTVVFTDETDSSQLEVLQDQNGNPPPFRYNVSQVLPNDVDVTFTLCMSGTPTAGDPCVIGSAAEIGTWGTGVNMTSLGGDLYEVTVTFAAGGNPNFEYKYRKDACVDWESVGNRAVTLPTDGTTSVTLPPDSFNNQPIGCGLGTTLEEDKTVCFQLCMEGVDNVGDVCVIGNDPMLTNWTSGVVMNHVAGDLYEVCLTWAAGTPIDINLEYKFKKDDCGTWESVGNRMLTINNDSPASQTLFHTWDNGPGTCQPVPTDQESFGKMKSRFGN